MGKQSCTKCGDIILYGGKRGKRGFTGPTGNSFTGVTGPTGAGGNEFDSIYVNNIYLLNTGNTGINIHNSFMLPTTGATASPFNFFSTESSLVTFSYDGDDVDETVIASRVGDSVIVTIPVLTFNSGGNSTITASTIFTNAEILPDNDNVTSTFVLRDGGITGPMRCQLANNGDFEITNANGGNIFSSGQLVTDPFSFTYVKQ